MFVRFVLLQVKGTISFLLLPSESRSDHEITRLLRYMEPNTYYMIAKDSVPLTLADYVLKSCEVGYQPKSKHKAFQHVCHNVIERITYTFKQELKWLIGVVESSQENENKQVIKEAKPSQAERRCEALAQWLSGRKLLYTELQSISKEVELFSRWQEDMLVCLIQGTITASSSVSIVSERKGKYMYRCNRCYHTKLTQAKFPCKYCGEHCYYCTNCLVMGQSRTCSMLVEGKYRSNLLHASSRKSIQPPQSLAQYGLSPAQEKVAETSLHYIYNQFLVNCKLSIEKTKMQQRRTWHIGRAVQLWLQNREAYERNYLIWAVTGAGKTEMIFPLIDYVTAQGGRVLLATPRRDVVLELNPRLHKAFPSLKIVTLYGGSEQRWQQGQLVIATTHQLMRFQKAFELVIIDELDAFPYHGDQSLYQAAKMCSYPGGVRVLLSATPPKNMQRAIARGQLAHSRLPVRYHRHPLPVPKLLTTPTITTQLQQNRIPVIVISAIKQSIDRGAQVFIFVQRIAQTAPYAALLQRYFPHAPIASTSSKDDLRSDKVQQFRQRQIRILVTTTILERGVTIAQSDVYICDADGALFDEASLVQMAGRAGRSSDDPYGKVYFTAKHRNTDQLGAVKQIISMNKLAKKHQYLLEQYW